MTCKSNWRDTTTFTGTAGLQIGLAQATKEQRLLLFGKNEINIEGKSTATLLVDEVCWPPSII